MPKLSNLGPLQTFYWLKKNPIELVTQEMLHRPLTRRKLLWRSAIFLNSAPLVETAFSKDTAYMQVDPVRKRLLRPLIASGLAPIEGDIWKRERQRAQPYFKGDYLERYGAILYRAAERACDDHISRGSVNLMSLISSAAFSGVAECFCGYSMPKDIPTGVNLFNQALHRQMAMDPADALGLPGYVPRVTKGRAALSLRRAAKYLDHIVQTRMKQTDSGLQFDDLLAACTSIEHASVFNAKQAREKFGTIMGAGFETTSLNLFWSLLFLMNSPADLDRALEEAKKETDLPPHQWDQAYPFLVSVLYEGMRLYPTIPAVARMAAVPFELDGHRIEAGEFVLANLWSLHRSPANWSNATAFMPSRFEGIHPNQFRALGFFPFGFGPRMCIGAKFSMVSGLTILVALLQRLDLGRSTPPIPSPVWRGTLRPSRSVFL